MHGMSVFKVVAEYLGLLLLFGVSGVQISVRMPVILTEVFCDFPQYVEENSEIVSRVRPIGFLYILLNSLLVYYAVI
jgi:hypothetical protein